MEKNKKTYDFFSSIVMFLLAVYFIFESLNIYTEAGKVFYLSAALVPAMLGGILFLLSLALFFTSLKEGGIKERLKEIKELYLAIKQDKNTFRIIAGIGIMALYIFVFMAFLPFWLATFLFILLLLYFLDAGSIIHITLIAATSVAFIVLLFQVFFRVPLP